MNDNSFEKVYVFRSSCPGIQIEVARLEHFHCLPAIYVLFRLCNE